MDNGKYRVGPDAFLLRPEFGAPEETIDHINRKIFRSYRGNKMGEVPADIFKLRYQVYCIECAFLQPDQYVDEMELDDYDQSSTHFGVYTMDETLVGTVRLVQPHPPKKFPFELYCSPFDDFKIPPWQESAEISRLVVKKSHRRRRADNVLGVPGIFTGQPEPIQLPADVERRDRTSPMLLLGIYREMYRYSRRSGIRYWFAAMERSLAYALRKMGFHFAPIGPQADYYGAVTPYMLDLEQLNQKLNDSNPTLAAWFHEKPLVLANSRKSRRHILHQEEMELPPDID